jgi:hypothetical protein
VHKFKWYLKLRGGYWLWLDLKGWTKVSRGEYLDYHEWREPSYRPWSYECYVKTIPCKSRYFPVQLSQAELNILSKPNTTVIKDIDSIKFNDEEGSLYCEFSIKPKDS